MSESCSVVSDSLQPHGLQSPWNSLGQNTGVGSLSLLQGVQSGLLESVGFKDPADTGTPSLPPIPLEKGKATHSSILAWRIPWAV